MAVFAKLRCGTLDFWRRGDTKDLLVLVKASSEEELALHLRLRSELGLDSMFLLPRSPLRDELLRLGVLAGEDVASLQDSVIVFSHSVSSETSVTEASSP